MACVDVLVLSRPKEKLHDRMVLAHFDAVSFYTFFCNLNCSIKN